MANTEEATNYGSDNEAIKGHHGRGEHDVGSMYCGFLWVPSDWGVHGSKPKGV